MCARVVRSAVSGGFGIAPRRAGSRRDMVAFLRRPVRESADRRGGSVLLRQPPALVAAALVARYCRRCWGGPSAPFRSKGWYSALNLLHLLRNNAQAAPTQATQLLGLSRPACVRVIGRRSLPDTDTEDVTRLVSDYWLHWSAQLIRMSMKQLIAGTALAPMPTTPEVSAPRWR